MILILTGSFHLSEVTEVYQANHQKIHEEVPLWIIFYVKILESQIRIKGDYWKRDEECSEELRRVPSSAPVVEAGEDGVWRSGTGHLLAADQDQRQVVEASEPTDRGEGQAGTVAD